MFLSIYTAVNKTKKKEKKPLMIVKKITNCYSDVHFRMVQHNVSFKSQKSLSHKQIGLLSGINNIWSPIFDEHPNPFMWESFPGNVSVKILGPLQLLLL